MSNKRTTADENRDRNVLLEYLRENPNQSFQEVELKAATGVHKGFIRGLLRGHPEIDQEELDRGSVRLIAASKSADTEP